MTTDEPFYAAVTPYFLDDVIDINTDFNPQLGYSPCIWAPTGHTVSDPYTILRDASTNDHVTHINAATLEQWCVDRDVLAAAVTSIITEYRAVYDAFQEAQSNYHATVRSVIERLKAAVNAYDATNDAIEAAVDELHSEIQAKEEAEQERRRLEKDEADDRTYGPRIFKIATSSATRNLMVGQSMRTNLESSTIHTTYCRAADRAAQVQIARPSDIITLINEKRLPATTPYDSGRSVDKLKLCERCRPGSAIDSMIPELRPWLEAYETERNAKQPPLPPKKTLRDFIVKFQRMLPWRIEGNTSGFDIVRSKGTDVAPYELQLTWFYHQHGPDEPMKLTDVNALLEPLGWIARYARLADAGQELNGCLAVRRMTKAEKNTFA